MKKLTFWGTRGSCPVSGPEYQYFGGNTSCLEIRYENTHIIIDAGTGIRPLGEALVKQKKGPIHLFLSHTHWDHLIGFPFFKPLDEPDREITIWSPVGLWRSTKELFNQLLAPEFFPVRLSQIKAMVTFRSIEEKTPLQMGPITLDFHKTRHNGITFCFKIKTAHQTIGYVTDNEIFHGYQGVLDQIPQSILELDQSLIDFLSECDLLIHEAQYITKEYGGKIDWGHASLSNTIALIKITKIKHWIVSHHDPKHTDEDLKKLEKSASELLDKYKIDCKVQWIGDGFELSLK